ncbi:MAG: MerR family transcriptional regulator [Megasphaera sp.]|jgi:DNA-binding transcriptional MerR regulator|nr:MerR family transcriptional regulator [Megasphaera sp.]
MMKRYYSIGETAKLLGISTQTLRHYEKIDLLYPKLTDEKTGYRYYSFDQFHMIDRIKYLQSLGMNLSEISPIMKKGTVEGLLPALKIEWQKSHEELRRLKSRIHDIEWYIDYFTYLSKTEVANAFYHIQMPERHIIQVPCHETDELADMEIRLAKAKASKALHDLPYRRQYGYIISIPDLLEQKFNPKQYFIYLKSCPDQYIPEYKELPAGEYLCFRTPILKESWDTESLRKMLHLVTSPSLALALEFEDNLVEYANAQYEVQIYCP